MIVNRDKARELAVAYVTTLDLKGFRYEYAGVSFNENRPNEWAVGFDVYTPSGGLMDGPVIFVVEQDTGLVRNFR